MRKNIGRILSYALTGILAATPALAQAQKNPGLPDAQKTRPVSRQESARKARIRVYAIYHSTDPGKEKETDKQLSALFEELSKAGKKRLGTELPPAKVIANSGQKHYALAMEIKAAK